MTPKHVVIVGGSVTGLGAALALSGDGHRVTILERDATPMPASHVEAFELWDRRGSPQVRHSHAFLGRLYGLIRDHAPDLLAKFLACGAEELRVMDQARMRSGPDSPAEPGDEDLVLLACRRITFQYPLRRHVLDSGRVEFRDGDEVTWPRDRRAARERRPAGTASRALRQTAGAELAPTSCRRERPAPSSPTGSR